MFIFQSYRIIDEENADLLHNFKKTRAVSGA